MNSNVEIKIKGVLNGGKIEFTVEQLEGELSPSDVARFIFIAGKYAVDAVNAVNSVREV
jgi:hypothetical protein